MIMMIQYRSVRMLAQGLAALPSVQGETGGILSTRVHSCPGAGGAGRKTATMTGLSLKAAGRRNVGQVVDAGIGSPVLGGGVGWGGEAYSSL